MKNKNYYSPSSLFLKEKSPCTSLDTDSTFFPECNQRDLDCTECPKLQGSLHFPSPCQHIRYLCLMWKSFLEKRFRKATWNAQDQLTHSLKLFIIRFQAPKFPFFSSSRTMMVHQLWKILLNRAELDKLAFHWGLLTYF